MPTCFFPGTDNYDVYTQLFCLFRFRTTAYLCDLLATVQRRKLPYFGHVARARNRCTEILEGRLDGKRRRSRPMRRCRDDIKGWSNRSVAECSRLAIERQATMKTTGARATTWSPTLSNEEGNKQAVLMPAYVLLSSSRFNYLVSVKLICASY